MVQTLSLKVTNDEFESRKLTSSKPQTLVLKIVKERGDAFQSGLALPFYFNEELDFCLADATQVLKCFAVS